MTRTRRHAHRDYRDYRWRSRFLMLRDAPDSAAEDWMAAGIALTAILIVAIVASGSMS